VKIDDVFADKMVQLGVAVFTPKFVKIQTLLVAQVFKAGHVADRRIQPNVKIFARRIGDFKTEIRRIAADVPLLQAAVQPFGQFVADFRLQMAGVSPLAQHLAKVGQIEKVMHRIFINRLGA